MISEELQKKSGEITGNMGNVRHGLFQLSQKVDYGLLLMSELAKNFELEMGSIYEPVSLHTIAEEHRMSFFFLQKIANDLRKAGLIESSRGKFGGYILAKNPAEINLREILEALEGPIAMMSCFTHQSDKMQCLRKGHCQVRNGLQLINQLLLDTLQKTTLYNLLHP